MALHDQLNTALGADYDYNGAVIALAILLGVGDNTFNGSCLAICAELAVTVTSASEALNYMVANPGDVAGLVPP